MVPPEVMQTTPAGPPAPPLPAARDRGQEKLVKKKIWVEPGQATAGLREPEGWEQGGPLAGGVAGDEVVEAGGDVVPVAERRRGAEEGLRLRRDAWIRGHGFSQLCSDPPLLFVVLENIILRFSSALRFCADFWWKNERESDGTALIKRKNRILRIASIFGEERSRFKDATHGKNFL